MTKSELTGKIAAKMRENHISCDKKNANVFVDVFVDVMSEALAAGEKVMLPNFGTFEVRMRKGKDCKNPRTKEVIHVEASKAVVFKPSKTLKTAVKESTAETDGE